MSPVARAGGVALSLVAHAAAAALLLTLSAADWSRPLFVDLVERAESPGAPAAGTPAQTAPAARSRERSGRASARGSRALASPERSTPPVAPETGARTAAASPPMPAAEPAPPPAPSAPLAPAPAPADSSPGPVDPPSPPASPAPTTSAPVRSGGTEGAPGARAGGEARGDASSSLGGARGSALALGSPSAGSGASDDGPYLRGFRQRVKESLVYPLAARRQGLRGTVELEISFDPSGQVHGVRVARSSGYEILDDAAVETIRRLGPLPLPELRPGRSLRVKFPLVFDLR